MGRFPTRFLDSILLLSSSINITNSFLCPSSFSTRYKKTCSLAIRLLSSSSSSSSPSVDSTSVDPEDLQRWERMYEEAQKERRESGATEFATSPVRVITFDLDNTLWNTSATIGAANDALALFVEEHAERQSDSRVEVVMGELFRANHSRYCPLWEESYVGQKKPGPVLLTRLRKDALRSILGDVDDDDSIVDQAFSVWENARYATIPHHLANGVVESLRELRQALPHVTVGAITDGNSNPLAIPILEGLFDFCVNAEQVGVSKPDPRVYHHAIQQHHSSNSTTAISDTTAVGPWWVHIGDDFVKDVVAAKTLGMRCIWARELILDRLTASAPTAPPPPPQRDEPPRSITIEGQTVLQMSVGADDYLADALQEEFADATVDSFREISETILQWHRDSLSLQDTPPPPSLEVASTLPLPPPTAPSLPPQETKSKSAADAKFCIHCGEKLPLQAKFCSACGERQDG